VATVAVVAWLAVGGAAQAHQQPAGAQPKAAAAEARLPAKSAAGYAGDETCLTCHERQAYSQTAHGRAWNASSPMANRGCESCHGPGKAHVDGSGDKAKIKTLKADMRAREINAQCLTCHTVGEPALWEGSRHDSRNMSCTTCHSIHSSKSEKDQLKTAGEFETCQQCHRAETQKVYRSAHMPVTEGKLGCSSCHNPHGSTNEKMLKAGTTVNEVCGSCHTDKRGPFLWEHAPVVHKCTTCHDAHGSTNDSMLVAKEPFLCQRCHVTAQHPSTVYDRYVLNNMPSANRIYGRSCAACHQNIHGSNAPSGKAFLR
jgi:DmsE family decaheme c-type cytochrome